MGDHLPIRGGQARGRDGAGWHELVAQYATAGDTRRLTAQVLRSFPHLRLADVVGVIPAACAAGMPSPAPGQCQTIDAGLATIDVRGPGWIDRRYPVAVVVPELAEARGSGRRRRYSYRDLVQLKVIRRLLDAGIALGKIRRVVAFLGSQLGEDLASASLVVNGQESLLVHHEGELIDVLRAGQGGFSVVALRALSAELDGAITDLRRSAPDRSALGDRVTA